ncbi:hypothetical protein PMIN06_011757 [Paraphaeosphaeria minitans]
MAAFLMMDPSLIAKVREEIQSSFREDGTAGRRLIIPCGQLHLHKSVSGDDAAEFDMNCFLDNTKVSSNPSYRPFGGGVTYCPGRLLAKEDRISRRWIS